MGLTLTTLESCIFCLGVHLFGIQADAAPFWGPSSVIMQNASRPVDSLRNMHELMLLLGNFLAYVEVGTVHAYSTYRWETVRREVCHTRQCFKDIVPRESNTLLNNPGEPIFLDEK